MLTSFSRRLSLQRYRFFGNSARRNDTGIIAQGFKASGVKSGIKKGKLDFSLFYSQTPANCAGVFTINKFRASCVDINEKTIQKNPKSIHAIVCNSGNANAITGTKGWDNTRKMQENTAQALGIAKDSVLVLNTGVIGRQLPMDKIQVGIEETSSSLSDSVDGWIDAATGILTTDKSYKLVSQECGEGRILGVAKGAGMIHPNMATMLSILTTDINITPECLQHALRTSVDKSFHAITVDGDTSTNDSVIIMANGQANNRCINDVNSGDFKSFVKVLTEVSQGLSQQIVIGAEGASKLISCTVYNAASQHDARLATKAVATSILTRCAMFGGEPNWGRILCAVGYSGSDVNIDKVGLWMTSPLPEFENEKCHLVTEGKPTESERVLTRCSNMIVGNRLDIHIDLQAGIETDTMWFPELSTEYVHFNSEYLT